MKPNWAFAGAYVAWAVSFTARVHAQAVPLDEVEEPKTQTPAEVRGPSSPPTPKAPKAPPKVVPPRALFAGVEYPTDGEGAASVILELIVSAEGTVTSARILEGKSPFKERALEAAQRFTFSPATRDGAPIAAKIRFLVEFSRPETAELAEDRPAETTGQDHLPTGDRKVPPAKAIEVLVPGERRPIAQRLGRAEVRELPGAFGDPFRAIEALPGVVPIMSGIPYFYVRGAPPGNVGYFFDGVPVPLLYHFAAGPGVLHPAFVDHVDLYPGAYPARFGRFAGGIVAGEMAPPNYEFRGEASIRLIDAGAMIEAPYADGKGSVMLGGRFSYTGLILSMVVPDVTLNYWDYQGRTRYALDDDDALEVLIFGSGDYLGQTETERTNGVFEERTRTVLDVGFHRIDARWDRTGEKSHLRTAAFLGIDRSSMPGAEELNDDLLLSNTLGGLRTVYGQEWESGLRLSAGADLLIEDFEQDLGSVQRDLEEVDRPGFALGMTRTDVTLGGYVELTKEVAPGIELTSGLRSDVFTSGNDMAVGLDPRLSARFRLDENLTAVHGLGISHQSPSFVVPIPGIKPSLRGGLQRALQHSAGVERKLPYGFQGSVTLFHNAFFNMTDFLGIARLSDTKDSEFDEFRTTGHAYGAEVMLRRSLAQDLGGFLSYTLSRSDRSSGSLEGPATTDRTHVLNLAASYNLGRDWRAGSRVLLYSGIPARVAYVEAAKNPPRTPTFWRLDVRLQKRWYIQRPDVWWGLVIEVLNTTLNKEVLDSSCNAYQCEDNEIGPVTIPSIGVEGAF